MATFRKVNFTMTRGNGYGQYYVIAESYKGKRIVIHTTDSPTWDAFNDEGETPEERKKHREALRCCYRLIAQEYNRIYK